MSRLKTIIINSLLTLVFCLTIMATALIINDAQAVQADAAIADASTQVVYLQLTDAPPQRDITLQQIAPLQ